MAGIAGLGVVLLFTQFMTLGLLAVSATGGALLGYGVKARQDRLPGATVGLLPGKKAEQGDGQGGKKVLRIDKIE